MEIYINLISSAFLQIAQRNDKLPANITTFNNSFKYLGSCVKHIYMQFDQSNPRLSFTKAMYIYLICLLKLHIYGTLNHIR